MYLMLVFLPFFGFFFAAMFGRYLGHKGSSFITILCLFFSFFISMFLFYEVAIIGCNVYIRLLTWIDSELLQIDWGFYLIV